MRKPLQDIFATKINSCPDQAIRHITAKPWLYFLMNATKMPDFHFADYYKKKFEKIQISNFFFNIFDHY